MSLIPTNTLGVPTPTLSATAGTAGTVAPTATAGTAGTVVPTATAGTAGTAAGGLSAQCRQVLMQVLSMLQSLIASMTRPAGTAGSAASLAGAPCPPGTIPRPLAPATSVAPVATAGTGISPAQIRTATPTPVAATPSFFTPIALPTQVPTVAQPLIPAAPLATPTPIAALAPLALPTQKIPLTDGNELQQRIQNFNRTSPGNTAGLVQFLNASYSNTAFTARPDGNLAYTVGTSNFLINATGLTPRVQV